MLAHAARMGPQAAIVFSVTGLILAVPAATLPFISAGKLGDERTSLLFTGVSALWNGDMHALSLIVLLCGGLLPFSLLAVLAILHAPGRAGIRVFGLWPMVKAARILESWSIPEVQVLAVLVALMKLGSLVQVTIGPGFWFYCAMALSLLLAEHSFDFEPESQVSLEEQPDTPSI
jgi:paraquat-inducible protein A